MSQSTEENAKQPTEKDKVKGFWGKAAIVWLPYVIIVVMCWAFLIYWTIFQSKFGAASRGIVALIIDRFTLLLLLSTFLLAAIIFGYSLVSQKIQAGITKQESKNQTEIEMLKLEICKIKCQRKLVESENDKLKSEKEK